MLIYCQIDNMLESGGVLIGKVKTDYSEIQIVDITEPTIYDKSGKYYFVRNKEHSQKLINEYWGKSDGILNYIGEWHTHPEINPSPSKIDEDLLSYCVKNNIYMFPWLFMIIVGYTGNLYLGYQTKKMIAQKKLELKGSD